MDTVQDLIDECARLCQGQNALARRLGVTSGRVSDWRRGVRQVTPEVLAQLCDIAGVGGERARVLLAHIECENPKHARSREVMRRAFFALSVAGAVLVPSLLPETSQAAGLDSIFIVTCWLSWMALRTSRYGRPTLPAIMRPLPSGSPA